MAQILMFPGYNVTKLKSEPGKHLVAFYTQIINYTDDVTWAMDVVFFGCMLKHAEAELAASVWGIF